MSPQAAKKRQTLRTPVTGKNERTPIISPYKPFDAAANTGTENPITFNDPIHGIIELHPLEKRIIDTPQFQRLDDLKQLGASNYVFRGATHTRFEHSIGVAHLAEKVVDILRKNLPESGVKITDKDTLCVKIAGLCHDLGHGPFSHVFDAVFIPRVWPKGIDGNGGEWRHEDGSVRMLNHLLETNGINLTSFGLEEQDKLFIEEIISGTDEKVRKGRKPEKFFLYDIVNNCRSGLDVDKLDYFKRDQQYANVALQTDFTRYAL
jgi:HD superfamily phosphohydrolase